MARNASGVYSLPAGTAAVSGATASSTNVNSRFTDLETDANTVRPLVAGGTGASTASGARTALGLGDMATQDSTGVAITGGTIGGANVSGLSARLVPSGAVMPFAMSTAPTGWMECNGANVSRTTYAALFAAIGTTFGAGDGSTTFGLPDMRGYFARGWDHGAGVDSGRAFGSTQADANLAHTHGVTDPGHVHGINENGGGAGTYFTRRDTGTLTGVHNTNSATTGISINSDGGTEARPKNVALMYCIKT